MKSQRYIFTSEKGKKYHTRLCPLMRSQNIYRVAYAEIARKGYQSCKLCARRQNYQDLIKDFI